MTRLAPKDPAPTFHTTDLTGRPIRLEAYRGQPLLLSFYRGTSCPLCNLRIRELIQHHTALTARGLQLLAFFESPPADLLEHVARQHPPLPLIPDPEHRVYARYGVEASLWGHVRALFSPRPLQALLAGFSPKQKDWGSHTLPADFLITPDGRIHTAHYGRDIADHLPLPQLYRALTALSSSPPAPPRP